MMRRAGFALLASALVTACLSPAPLPTSPTPSPTVPTGAPASSPRSSPTTSLPASPSPMVAASIDPVLPLGRLVQCGAGAPAFPAEILQRPGSAESGTDVPTNLLRGLVSRPADENNLPQAGWTRIEVSPKTVLFIARGVDGWKVVGVELGANGWAIDQYGSCRLAPLFAAGVNAAVWWIDPAADPLEPDATRVAGLVNELACASGRPPIGRVLDPVIDDRPDRVIVTFGVRDQPGGQDCQGSPPLAVPFVLPTPLGTRRLFDGGEFPPRDAAIPAP